MTQRNSADGFFFKFLVILSYVFFLFSHRESTATRTRWDGLEDGSWQIKPGVLTSEFLSYSTLLT